MKRIIAEARKEIRQLLRDRLAIVLALILPLSTIVILGVAISLTLTELPIVIQDLDRTLLSRSFLDLLGSSLSFRILSWPIDANPEKALDKGSARASIVIPEHFERDILRNRDVEVQILLDATDANTANIIRGKATAITDVFISGIRHQ